MAENSSQTSLSPSRGFFTWHEDMRRLDGRVGTIDDRVAVLEGDVLKSGDLRVINHKICLIETRLQGLAEIMDQHSTFIAQQESMTVPTALANAAVSGLATVLTGREGTAAPEPDLTPSAPMPTTDAVAYAPPAGADYPIINPDYGY